MFKSIISSSFSRSVVVNFPITPCPAQFTNISIFFDFKVSNNFMQLFFIDKSACIISILLFNLVFKVFNFSSFLATAMHSILRDVKYLVIS